MTTSEVAEFFSVSVHTVRGWVADGRLPALRTPSRVGANRGRIRIRRADVEGFLTAVAVSSEAAELTPTVAAGGPAPAGDPAWHKEDFLP